MNPNDNLLIQFIPAVIFSVIYAAIVYAIARRRRINPWVWTIATLVPIIGMIVSWVFLLLSFLSVLDRLNALEDERGRQSA